MPYTISEIIVFFFTYSVVGWVWETIYCSLKDHHFAYRGFLFGPYCPVYGFAVTTILIATYHVQHDLLMLFIVGFIVASLFEYYASLFLEKTFKLKLWDYSKLWGNIQGRVAPQISLFWGIGVVILVRYIHPLIQRVINWEEEQTHGMLALLVVVGMGTDAVLTIISVKHFHTTTQMWNERVINYQEQLRQKVRAALPQERSQWRRQLDSWHISFVQHLDEIQIRRLNWNERRFLKSFPRLKFLDAKHFNEIKEDLLKK
jgi:uncharacterized membrane protein